MHTRSCRRVVPSIVVFAVALAGCAPGSGPESAPPYEFVRDDGVPDLPFIGPIEPVVAVLEPDDNAHGVDAGAQPRQPGRRLEGPLSEAEIEALQTAALAAPFNGLIQLAVTDGPRAPTPGVGFESLDFATAGGNFVPPDPELAVGPNHIIAVVNDYIEVYDRFGVPLLPPIQFSNFFAGIPGCANLFDPNVLYDEQLDRFVVGIDANATGYCIAMSQTPDPLQPWSAYGFSTVPPGPVGTRDFFDYPHAGVGDHAIFVGANVYNNTASTFLRAEVWAVNKNAMAAGVPLPMPVMQPVINGFTPQPMNAHGWLQGTWPAAPRPHTIVANSYLPGPPPVYSGDVFDVWAWSDPFGANIFGLVGPVDLGIATGVPATYPIDAPQLGGLNLQANDWRVLDCEYRNGDVWMTQTISCNPGPGVVDCVRWAEIDPTVPAVRQAGIFASVDEFRIFPDAAVNHCDDLTVGYTKTSLMMLPAVWVTGRLGTDPPGSLQPEAQLRIGDVPYLPFDPPPHRWGDYSGGTSDADGVGTWYLGEYSKQILPPPAANWGTYVGQFTTSCGVDLAVTKSDGVTQVAPGGQVTYTIVVSNLGRGDAVGAVVSDTFPSALGGVTWTCAGQVGPPMSVCSSTSGTGNLNLSVDIQAGAWVTITATGTLSPTATGMLTNTAAASYAGVVDPAPGNNTATDTDTILPASDLAITKVDGQATAVPGEPVTYTVVVSNNGPLNAVGAVVTDVLPATVSNVSWTCAGQAGPPVAVCGNPSGVGNISELVNIDVGAAATYTITADILPGATGALVNTASVAPPAGVVDPVSGNDSATDTDTLTPEADLSVVVTDGSCFVLPGGSTVYTVAVGNAGASDAPAISVTDTVPGDLTIGTWSCSPSGAASCGSATGSGSLTDSPSLPPGDSVTYTVPATVAASASGWLTYTVAVAPGAGVTDPDPGNDSDSDIDALETPVFCDGFEDSTVNSWSASVP